MTTIYVFLILLISPIAFGKFEKLDWKAPDYLEVGKTLAVPHAQKLWIENSEILEGKDLGTSLLIKGKKPGTSWIKTNSGDFEIQVLSTYQTRLFQCLRNLERKSLGLKVTADEGAVQLKGNLLRFYEWGHLSDKCASKSFYQSRFSVPDELKQIFERNLKRELKKEGLAKVELRWSPWPVALVMPQKKLSPGAERWLRSRGLTIEEDPSLVDSVPQVKVNVLVAEIRRDRGLKLGIDWPSSYQASLASDQKAMNNLFVNALFLENQGIGQTLARPELLARSGTSAEFWAGGEFPIKIIGRKTQDVQWKKYGILLKVKPIADAKGRMSIQIATEVSSIDSSRTIDGVPGLLMNRMDTHFDLDRPQAIVLSGLIKKEQSESWQGLPGLGSIPILGKLFSSQDYRNSRSELVIVVRPQVIDPSDPTYLADSGGNR